MNVLHSREKVVENLHSLQSVVCEEFSVLLVFKFQRTSYCMKRALLSVDQLTLEYLLVGEGSHPVLCLHGFGREAADFIRFQPMLAKDEYLVSINLFQHGESKWPAQRPLTQSLTFEEHSNLIQALLRLLNAERFSLLAYSMGGRIALSTIALFPEQLRNVLLIAPDGLKINQLYKFAAGTSAGRSLYRGIMRRPSVLLRTADTARSLRLITDKLHRFVYVHMDHPEKRRLVYESWLIYRRFEPNLPHIAELVNEHDFTFRMLFGRYDSVIKPSLGKRFNQLLNKNSHLHLIDAGHQLMTENTVDFILEKRLWH